MMMGHWQLSSDPIVSAQGISRVLRFHLGSPPWICVCCYPFSILSRLDCLSNLKHSFCIEDSGTSITIDQFGQLSL